MPVVRIYVPVSREKKFLCVVYAQKKLDWRKQRQPVWVCVVIAFFSSFNSRLLKVATQKK